MRFHGKERQHVLLNTPKGTKFLWSHRNTSSGGSLGGFRSNLVLKVPTGLNLGHSWLCPKGRTVTSLCCQAAPELLFPGFSRKKSFLLPGKEGDGGVEARRRRSKEKPSALILSILRLHISQAPVPAALLVKERLSSQTVHKMLHLKYRE